MFYNIKYNVCGLWNPKTGSSSMREALHSPDSTLPNDYKNWLDGLPTIVNPEYIEHDAAFAKYAGKVHLGLHQAIRCLTTQDGEKFLPNTSLNVRYEILKETLFFTTVRNPWARAVSHAKMRQRVGRKIVKDNADIGRGAGMAKELYEAHGEDLCAYLPRSVETEAAQTKFWKFYGYMTPRRLRIYDINMIIMQQENLQDDFNSLCKEIGVKPITLPYENVSTYDDKEKDYRRYFETKENEHLIEQIRIKDQETIALKNYTYE